MGWPAILGVDARGSTPTVADERTGEDLAHEAGLERVADIARRLAETDSLDETLQRIVDLSTGYLEHCDGATLMIVRKGEVSTPASTDIDSREADMAQYRAGEGPCLSSMEQHETIVIDDIADDDRWPAWSEEVRDLGWVSMTGLPLFIARDTMGALNLYSRRTKGFDRHSQILAQVFASHASVAMKSAISESGLNRALESRDVIGQAKGMLMERERLTGEQAFQRLVQASNDRNVKLREVAEQAVRTGELPD